MQDTYLRFTNKGFRFLFGWIVVCIQKVEKILKSHHSKTEPMSCEVFLKLIGSPSVRYAAK
ncbi:MAG: hypothetical protein ACI4W1_00550 [Ruminococcus sp.]